MLGLDTSLGFDTAFQAYYTVKYILNGYPIFNGPFGVRQSLLTHVQKQRLLHSITYLTKHYQYIEN